MTNLNFKKIFPIDWARDQKNMNVTEWVLTSCGLVLDPIKVDFELSW